MNHYEDINLQKFAVLCESVKKSYCRKPYRINK